MKKALSIAVSAILAVSSFVMPTNQSTEADATSSEGKYNYVEALQKSMFFYQVQQCGEIPDWNKVSWRDDSMTNDFISGGWFDAGDHLKFTLTNAYSAAVLGWGLLEYPEGVENYGLLDEYKLNLKWALDYIAACDLGDEVVYMIGDGAFDHVWWGAAEVYMQKFKLMTGEEVRPYYTTKNSSITGQMAASLAVGYLVFKDSDPELAQSYLDHAINCFEIADTNRALGDEAAQSSYYKTSSFYDDLFYAANFLYMATGDQSNLDLAESDYVPNLQTEQQSDELKFSWGYCWDDVMQPAILLYAINTGEQKWKDHIQKHLDYWTIGYGGKSVSYTPDGLAWLFNWGSLRHATTTAFLANVAADNIFKDDETLYNRYIEFADSQMNYCFGDNANNFSYVIGMGEDYPKAWHHRTSSGVWDDKWSMLGDTKDHAHILYGALVGGPNQSGKYTDKVSAYEYTEVAIDYNAGYTSALCAMAQRYGGTYDPNFPEEETPKWDEFYIEACINQSSQSYTEIKVQATNHSAWPARVIKDLSYNYYMDFTELFEAGLTIDDITTKIGYDEFDNCTISDPIHYQDNIYYVKISYEDGTKIMPTGQSEHQGEIQFRVSIPDPTPVWDSSNDYSIDGLVKQDLTVTKKITMYDGDKLIWGIEPDGTTPDTDTTDETETTVETETTEVTETTTPYENPDTSTETDVTTSVTTTGGVTSDNTNTDETTEITSSEDDINWDNVLYGDVDENGSIDIFDVVLVNKYINGTQSLSDTQKENANCSYDEKIDILDSLSILKFILGFDIKLGA